jgi:hypothetical protein
MSYFYWPAAAAGIVLSIRFTIITLFAIPVRQGG